MNQTTEGTERNCVGEPVEELRHHTFGTAHAEMPRNKHEWIEHFDHTHLALGWIPIGDIPSIAGSAERLSE